MHKPNKIVALLLLSMLFICAFSGCRSETNKSNASDSKQSSVIPPWKAPKDKATHAKELVEQGSAEVNRQFEELER